jgi:branched-chain amino acid transport system ATP-binding protein
VSSGGNIVLEARKLEKRFDGTVAASGVDIDVRAGEIHAVIGPNGAGKSTLINMLSGELRPDSGTVHLKGEDVTALPVYRRAARGIARSYQTTSIFPEFSVLDNVALAIQSVAGHSLRFVADARRDPALREPAARVLAEVGLAHRTAGEARSLAHGEKRQVEFAMALAMNPRILLLDEPLAGMAHGEAKGIIELMRTLKARAPILLVEHDMQAVFALADRITVLVYGRVIASGRPEAIAANREVRTAYLAEEV